MIKQNEFKWENLVNDMVSKYLLYELNINKKFARKQEISWEEIKKHIFEIIKEISAKKLFKKEDKDKTDYNLLDKYENDYSLCVCPINQEGNIITSNLLSPDNKNKLVDTINDDNFSKNSFMNLFYLGVINHKDAIIFEEGAEKNMWSYTGDNAGLLSKTAFGIIVSDKLEKVIIIKKSDNDSIGLSALLSYLSAKSHHYRTLNSSHTIRPYPFVKDKNFNPEDISSLFGLDISINADLIGEYRQKTGQNDLLFNILQKFFPKLSRSGRKMGFNMEFSEEGDKEAIDIFNNIYSSFLLIQGEEVEKMFNRFKINYENTEGQSDTINFKRNKIYKYEPETDKSDFEHIFDAFVWLCDELNKLGDE